MNRPLLKIENLNTGYDKRQVLHDVSLQVEAGEIFSIIGPNGSGKSTLLKVIFGLLPVWSGDIHFDGSSIAGKHPSQQLCSGLAYAPQGNRVFDELTIRENLDIAGLTFEKELFNERLHHVLSLFPVLKDRLKQNAGTLSGGEQQMLALARVMMSKPRLLLLDEPSLGLAPNLITEAFNQLKKINEQEKLTLVIVEQKVNEIFKISNRTCCIRLGRVAYEGSSDQLSHDKALLKKLFL